MRTHAIFYEHGQWLVKQNDNGTVMTLAWCSSLERAVIYLAQETGNPVGLKVMTAADQF